MRILKEAHKESKEATQISYTKGCDMVTMMIMIPQQTSRQLRGERGGDQAWDGGD